MNKPEEKQAVRAGTMKLIAGRLCLDYANTVDWHIGPKPIELLRTYTDLVFWGQNAGLLSVSQAEVMIKKFQKNPPEFEKQLLKAVRLRDAIFNIFLAVVKKEQATPEDIALLNHHLLNSKARIIPTETGYTWELEYGPNTVDRVLQPVTRSAANLLTSAELTQVKMCGDQTCGWLFLDVSRNRSRRWCDMKGCGNRAKASRFYKRKKTSATDCS